MYYQTMQSQSREKQQQLRQEARLHRSTRQSGNHQDPYAPANLTGKMLTAAVVVATAAATLIYLI